MAFLTSPLSLTSQVRVTHGPLVGAVTSESARFVVRTESHAQVHLQVGQSSAFSNPLSTTPVTTESSSDFFSLHDITGLEPDTQYFYRAVIDNVPQNEARSFRSFPLVDTEVEFTFAFGGCQQAADDPNSTIGRVFPLIAQDAPRFFLQLGDWTYPDTTDTRANPNDYFNIDFSRVQASYRSKYDPAFPMNELLKVAPVDYIYDDHDYSNNDSDRTFPAGENSVNGYRAMFPHYPLANPDNGLWHKFTFANADFFMLDTRTQRDPNERAFRQVSGNTVFDPKPGHLILQSDPNISGELQMDWLIRELQASQAHWKFICTSVPFNPSHRALLEVALFLQGTELDPFPLFAGGIAAAELAKLLSDSWNGFPESVRRLVKAVHESNIENVIVLSGDSHTAGIDDGANSLFPEAMAGGLDRSNSRLVAAADFLGLELWNRGGQTLQRNNFNSHFGQTTVFGDDSVRVELIDEFGELITQHTIKSGHLVSPLGLTYAFESRDFGQVEIGANDVRLLRFINTGVDTILIENVRSTNPQFTLAVTEAVIAPGRSQDVAVLFQPQNAGDVFTIIRVESNDPESPFAIRMQGRGIQPTSVDDRPSAPSVFSVAQNYPNPFNAITSITYQLPQPASVVLQIFNVAGQEIRRFTFATKTLGRHAVQWDGRDQNGQAVSTGVYLYRLEAAALGRERIHSPVQKMILLK